MERNGAAVLGRQIEDTAQINELMSLLERRVALLRVLRAALGEPGVYVRIGQRERDSGDALARRWSRPATGWRSASWAPSR